MPYLVRLYRYYWDKNIKRIKHESIASKSLSEKEFLELEKLLSIGLRKGKTANGITPRQGPEPLVKRPVRKSSNILSSERS